MLRSTLGLNGPFVASRILNLMRGKIMSIEYKVRISEKQRKLIMRALTTTVANNIPRPPVAYRSGANDPNPTSV